MTFPSPLRPGAAAGGPLRPLLAALSAATARRLPDLATLAPGARVLREGPLALLLGPPPAPGSATPAGREALARDLVARSRLAEALMPAGDLLLARPGILLGEEEARRCLVANAPLLVEALAVLEGRVQYEVRLDWDPAGALRRFAESPELAAAQAEPPGPARARAFAEGAAALARRIGGEARERLSALALDTIDLPAAPPEGLAALVLLVAPGGEAAIETALGAIDALWPEGFRLRLIGPLPPVAFAALEADRPAAGEIAAAAARLGLDPAALPPAVEARTRTLLRALGPDPGPAAAPILAARALLVPAARARAALAAAGDPAPDRLPPLLALRREGIADAEARVA